MPDVCAALGDVELMHVVLLPLMKIDGLLMQRGKRARKIDFTDDSWLARGFDNDKIIRADASERHRVRRIRVTRPMPLVARTMDEPALAQKVQNLRHIVHAKPLVRAKRQFERCALEMADEDVNVIGIDQSHFRRLA